MKFLLLVCSFAALAAFAVISGAVAVGCGPQQDYCPNNTTGECNQADTGTAPPPVDSGTGPGDAIIIVID